MGMYLRFVCFVLFFGGCTLSSDTELLRASPNKACPFTSRTIPGFLNFVCMFLSLLSQINFFSSREGRLCHRAIRAIMPLALERSIFCSQVGLSRCVTWEQNMDLSVHPHQNSSNDVHSLRLPWKKMHVMNVEPSMPSVSQSSVIITEGYLSIVNNNNNNNSKLLSFHWGYLHWFHHYLHHRIMMVGFYIPLFL